MTDRIDDEGQQDMKADDKGEKTETYSNVIEYKDRLIHKTGKSKEDQPKPNPFKDRTTTIDAERLAFTPLAKPTVLNKYPVGCSSGIVSEGGLGKTQYACRDSIHNAIQEGETLFISAEDNFDDYQAKLYNMINTPDTALPAHADLCASAVIGRVHVMNLRGSGAKLVAPSDGSYRPSLEARQLAEFIKEHYPKVNLIFFETVSRLAGGEDNERLEAYVTATDLIAIHCNCACVSVHHVGKSQAREKVRDLYSGRGGSAFGDNTRCMLVMTRLDDNYKGELPTTATAEEIESGKVFEVKHVRHSYGPTIEIEYFITANGISFGPVLKPIQIANMDDEIKMKLEQIERLKNVTATKIAKIIKSKGGKVPRKFFDKNTRDLLGVTQEESRSIIEDMLDAGSLTVIEERTAAGQNKKYLINSKQNKGV